MSSVTQFRYACRQITCDKVESVEEQVQDDSELIYYRIGSASQDVCIYNPTPMLREKEINVLDEAND